jgi:DNA helicase-2/ATP-dependent DNA helicase PcrA
MRRLLHVAMTRAREGLVLAYAAHTDSGALQTPSPFAEEARTALGAEWEDRDEELFGPDESLHATYQALRDELIAGSADGQSRSASCASTPTSTSPTGPCATWSC